jgi:acyl CoA:acetate/3-ketoacid CoA transferase beta subunit
MEVKESGLLVKEISKEITKEQLQAKTGADLEFSKDLRFIEEVI